MSTIERKEYQETKIMRTVSPVRNFRSSSQNLAEFDHNLDYLLEDLQNSVSRPGSSLGTHRDTSKTIESSRTNSLNRFSNVKSSNPVTEYSSDDAYNYTVSSVKRRFLKDIKITRFSPPMAQNTLEATKKNLIRILAAVEPHLRRHACKIVSTNWTRFWTICSKSKTDHSKKKVKFQKYLIFLYLSASYNNYTNTLTTLIGIFQQR